MSRIRPSLEQILCIFWTGFRRCPTRGQPRRRSNSHRRRSIWVRRRWPISAFPPLPPVTRSSTFFHPREINRSTLSQRSSLIVSPLFVVTFFPVVFFPFLLFSFFFFVFVLETTLDATGTAESLFGATGARLWRLGGWWAGLFTSDTLHRCAVLMLSARMRVLLYRGILDKLGRRVESWGWNIRWIKGVTWCSGFFSLSLSFFNRFETFGLARNWFSKRCRSEFFFFLFFFFPRIIYTVGVCQFSTLGIIIYMVKFNWNWSILNFRRFCFNFFFFFFVRRNNKATRWKFSAN